MLRTVALKNWTVTMWWHLRELMNSSGSTNRFCAVPKWIPSPPRLLCCHCICGSNKLLMDSWSGTQLQADYWGRWTPEDWRPDWISTLTHRESVLQTRPSFQDHMGILNASGHFCPPLTFLSALLRCSLYIIRTFLGLIMNKWPTESFLLFICACSYIWKHNGL